MSRQKILIKALFLLVSCSSLYTVSANIPKKWNFIVYIAGNNNLHRFALWNLKQMLQVGSNDNINILVQVDQWGKKNTTRYYIARNEAQIVDSYITTASNASGTTQSLFDCAKWAIKSYQADHHAIIVWNHGAGAVDPHIWGRLMPTQHDPLYVFNEETCLLEIDRKALIKKAIGFNETFETYLSNQELTSVLSTISEKLLGGKKIEILGMDACYMSMIEVASQIKNSVHFMVGSEDLEPGPGWNYQYVLEPFLRSSLSPHDFACHIVKSYEKEYKHVISDYTQSAIDMSKLTTLEENVNLVALSLLNLLSAPGNETVFLTIQKIRQSNLYTTAFYNANYIDLQHFYKSLLGNMGARAIHSPLSLIEILEQNLRVGIDLINKACIANVRGPAFTNANGISIYFPTRSIHDSYPKTIFAQTTSWLNFLTAFVKKAGRIMPSAIDCVGTEQLVDDLNEYFPTDHDAVISRNNKHE